MPKKSKKRKPARTEVIEDETINSEDLEDPEDDEELEEDSDVTELVAGHHIQPCEPCEGSRIEIAREGDDYHWMLYSKNGRQIATNPIAFTRLNDLKETLKSVRENIDDADLVRLY